MRIAFKSNFKIPRNGFVSGYLLILFGLLILAGDISAQYFPRKKFTIRNGLPQSQVLAVNQHEDGHIWLTTKGGIARFDGKVFEQFDARHGFHPDQYNEILFLNDSTIFLGVQRGIAQWFHINQLRFDSQMLFRNAKPVSWKVLQNKDGRILHFNKSFSQKNDFPIWLRDDSTMVPAQEYKNFADYKSVIQSWKMNHRDSTIWIFDDQSRLFQQKGSYLKLIHQFPEVEGRSYLQFLKGPNDEFLAFFPGNMTIYQLLDGIMEYRKLPKSPYEEMGWTNSIQIDGENNVFFLRDRSELWALFHHEEDWTFVDRFNFVSELFIDRENNLYVPDEGALYVFNNFAFRHYSLGENGLPKYVWSAIEDDQSRLWLGSYGHGLKVWDFEQFDDLSRIDRTEKGGYPLENIYMGAIKDQHGNILMPGTPHVYVFNHQKELIKRIECDREPALIIWEDAAEERIYAGTPKGVFVVDNNYNQVAHLYDTTLMRRPVVSIAKTRDDKLWMGTWENIISFDGQSFEGNFTNDQGEKVTAKCMENDLKGNLWMGGMNGLHVYDGSLFKRITEKPFQGIISFITTIDKHQLLVGLPDGIALVDLQKYYDNKYNWYQYYGSEEGFIGIEPGQNGAFVRPDGKAWIITTDQLTFFDPALLKSPTYSTFQLEIDNVQQVNAQEEWETIYTRRRANRSNVLAFDYPLNRIRFNYKAIHHTSPDDIQYSYRLIGNGEEWSPYHDQRNIEFTNLSPGDYELQISARHANQPHGERVQTASLAFKVSTPLYMQWWFILGMVVCGGVLVSVITAAVVKNRRNKRELAEKLRFEMCQLQYRALKSQVEPHFASNLLNSVNAAILREDRTSASRILSNFARMIRDILQYNDRMVYSLHEELAFVQLYIDLEKNILKERLEYIVDLDESVDLERKIPVMLLHTFVENAVKHAIRQNINGGRISLSIKNETDELHIAITDTGREGESRVSPEQSSGKGVSLVENIVSYHNKRNSQWKMRIHIDDSRLGRTVLVIIPNYFTFDAN